MVENSTSPCKRMFVRFSSRVTVQIGQCIRKAHPFLTGIHLPQADHCHFVGVFSLHPRSHDEAWDRQKRVTKDFPCCPPSGGGPCGHGWGKLPVALGE